MADAQATSRSPVVPIQPLSESSIALLRELVAHLRESRTQLREEWAHRMGLGRIDADEVEVQADAEIRQERRERRHVVARVR